MANGRPYRGYDIVVLQKHRRFAHSLVLYNYCFAQGLTGLYRML